jgi:hypothetical protein
MVMVEARQPVNHLLLLELVQSVEVKVAVPLVPLPRSLMRA